MVLPGEQLGSLPGDTSPPPPPPQQPREPRVRILTHFWCVSVIGGHWVGGNSLQQPKETGASARRSAQCDAHLGHLRAGSWFSPPLPLRADPWHPDGAR